MHAPVARLATPQALLAAPLMHARLVLRNHCV
jgi:hypothetical protein